VTLPQFDLADAEGTAVAPTTPPMHIHTHTENLPTSPTLEIVPEVRIAGASELGESRRAHGRAAPRSIAYL